MNAAPLGLGLNHTNKKTRDGLIGGCRIDIFEEMFWMFPFNFGRKVKPLRHEFRPDIQIVTVG